MQERERSRGQRLDDQREATTEVIARTAVESHSRAVLPGNNPNAGGVAFRFWLGGTAQPPQVSRPWTVNSSQRLPPKRFERHQR
jgi:hypothetical protein